MTFIELAKQIVFCCTLVACGGPAFTIDSNVADAAPFIAEHADAGPETKASVPDSSTPESTPESSVASDAQIQLEAAADTAHAAPPDVADALMCVTPTTPLLSTGVGGHYGGIQFHVTHNTVLTSFVYTGAMQADTVTLSDDQCNAIVSASVPNQPPPGYAPYTVNVHWPLTAGTSYRLTNSVAQTAFGGYPLALPYVTGELVVENGLVVCPDDPQGSMVWTAFTNLTFCSE